MVSDEQFIALSDFRYRLTLFLRSSEQISHQLGVSTTQYQLLLHIRAAGHQSSSTIGELAKRLGTTHQSAVALVKRCEARGLVSKQRSTDDERKVEVRLTPYARRLIGKLAERHIEALGGVNDVIRITHLTDGTSTPRLGAPIHSARGRMPKDRGRASRQRSPSQRGRRTG